MSRPHLDVLVEDEFSRFVADGLDPTVVVNAYRDRINLGVRSTDETVDVFLGGLSAEEARSLGSALIEAAEYVEERDPEEAGRTWTVFEPGDTPDGDQKDGTEENGRSPGETASDEG